MVVLAEAQDIDRDALVAILRDAWALHVSSLRYEAVGFGSHHYVVDDTWFVTVDELTAQTWLGANDVPTSLDALERAFRTTVALRGRNLEFVNAPVATRNGDVLVRLGAHYAVTAYRFVDGATNPSGEFESPDERRLVLEALGRLHATTVAVPARRDDLVLPDRAELERALDELDLRWTGGPFAEPARRLLRTNTQAVRQLLGRYDYLVRAVAPTSASWVVTHGEPHAGNVMWTHGGEPLLVDWGTVAITPRERDLWQVADPADAEDWSAYTRHAPSPAMNPDALQLYCDWWALAEIAGYTRGFRAPHDDDPNTREAWKNLNDFVPRGRP